MTPIGWKRTVVIDALARSQLLSATPVKTNKRGAFVTDQNIQLTEPYDRSAKKKNKKYSSKKQSSYKGPDDEGNYLTYAIVLLDKTDGPDVSSSSSNGKNETKDEEAAKRQPQQPQQPDVDLRLLHPYMERFETDPGEWAFRLIPRRFGVRQSRRRVRTMIQKIESYVKRRRQKLSVRENSPPSWQGVLLMVFGCIGVILSAVLGHFRDESAIRGPGARQHQKRRVKHTVADSYASTTPARYEVRTSPAVPAASSSTTSVQKAGYQRNTTQARKRTAVM